MSDLKVNWSLALSSLSIVSSSLLWTLNYRRDRERLKITLHIRQYEGRVPDLIITAVNSGRRPMVLTELGMDYEDKGYRTLHLNGEDGVNLKEKERYIVPQQDLEYCIFNPDSDSNVKSIWFRDSVGKVHRAKGTRKVVKNFYKRLEALKQLPQRRRSLTDEL